MNEKISLRQHTFATDRNVSDESRVVQSQMICNLIAEKLSLCGNVLCFMPLTDEVDITPLFDMIRLRGGNVILPYCVDRSHMVLKRYDADTPLVQDAMHVLSPQREDVIDPCLIDEALIPAVALTRDGKRLGRGGGFYDRMIPRFRTDTVKVGVCFQNRILSDIPMAGHDALVDFVISANVPK